MGIGARDVIEIVARCSDAGATARLEGGWGIDALLGAQNREHDDVDLVIDEEHADAVRAALLDHGFEVHFEEPPGRCSFIDAAERIVDVCFVAADRYGDRWCINRLVGRGEPDYPFDCFTYGWVAGQQVSCLNPETQVLHHLGYEIEPVDRWDVELLRARFDVAVPDLLRTSV
jgi:lincosamide nucleotidyltransferase A/C/D/E